MSEGSESGDRRVGESARALGEWLVEMNEANIAKQPLRWMPGRYHTAAGITHVYNEIHDDSDSFELDEPPLWRKRFERDQREGGQ